MSLSHLRPTRLPLLSFLYPRATTSPPLHLPPISNVQTRPASHSTEGRANGAKNGPGKRLGAKRGSTELVVPGNIIFRQRGTQWFPGENCGMGRDHTIFAKEKGYVTYYRDEERHPKRKYIGVVFERGMTLPVDKGEPRRRRLGLVAREMSTVSTPPPPTPAPGVIEDADGSTGSSSVPGAGGASQIRDPNALDASTRAPASSDRASPQTKTVSRKKKKQRMQIKLRENYSYREANWEIGRAAEYAGVKVEKYDRNDRFAAWRKRNAKKAEEMEKRMLKKSKKGKARAK